MSSEAQAHQQTFRVVLVPEVERRPGLRFIVVEHGERARIVGDGWMPGLRSRLVRAVKLRPVLRWRSDDYLLTALAGRMLPDDGAFDFWIGTTTGRRFSPSDRSQEMTPSKTEWTTTTDDLGGILADAAAATPVWRSWSPTRRANALRAVAAALDTARPQLVEVAEAETSLTGARLSGEVDRTTFQLRLFAQVLAEGAYLGIAIDHADPHWAASGRSDIRRILRPLGPVVVFAASNFPFAFSVAGGDTASALAAGCPVVLKAHPGHPQLSDDTAKVVTAALADVGAPAGTFNLIYGESAGRAAVCDPRIKAGAFTGSLGGGRALFDLAAARPEPIPFYGELGSLNPAFVTPDAMRDRGDEILTGYAASFTLGAGQFCTKPGFLFVPNEDLPAVQDRVASAIAGQVPTHLLNEHIARGYRSELDRLRAHPAMHTVIAGNRGGEVEDAPSLLATTTADLLAHPDDLLVECFGPLSIVVGYDDDQQLLSAAEAFSGQLTATIHATGREPVVGELLEVLVERAGRVVWNEWPTGVAVTWAMQHGGPYPATTAPSTTSVGASAIARFLRPVAYQSVPDHLLPLGLQDANPLAAPRWVDGSSPPVS